MLPDRMPKRHFVVGCISWCYTLGDARGGTGISKRSEPIRLTRQCGDSPMLGKAKAPEKFSGAFTVFSCGGRICTCGLRVMSPTSYRTAPPRGVCSLLYTPRKWKANRRLAHRDI